MVELEREFTYLVEELPEDLSEFPSVIVEDNYVPMGAEHPTLRIRRKGEKYEVTKKCPVDSEDGGQSGDSSRHVEHTTPLTRAEYEVLNSCEGKRLIKRRVFYEADGVKSDIDVFLGEMMGLVTADFEFSDDEEMKRFVKPGFVGADVSQELMIAGGMLCGKCFSDVGEGLGEKYGYRAVVGVEKFGEGGK